jgi:tetratricopeptide (TPR) repeat protein
MKSFLNRTVIASCIFYAFGFLSLSAVAQPEIDSLKKLIRQAREDTAQLNALNILARKLSGSDLDTAFILGNQALELSKKIITSLHPGLADAGKKGMAKAYHNLGYFNNQKGDYSLAMEHYNTALKFWKELKDAEGTSRSTGNLGIVYMNLGKYPEALEYSFAALRINDGLLKQAKKNNSAGQIRTNEVLMGIWHGNIGLVYMNQGDYRKALEHYHIASRLAENTSDKAAVARQLSNIGIVHWYEGNYPKALSSYFDALKIYEERKDNHGIGTVLGNIGLIYNAQKSPDKALEYYQKAIAIFSAIGAKEDIELNLGNIGIIYQDKKDYRKALDYYAQALKIAEEINDVTGIARHLGNIGITYFWLGEFNLALDHYMRALQQDTRLGNKNGIARHLTNIASLYTEQKKYREAEQKLLEAESITYEINSLILISKVQEQLSLLYAQMNNYKPALDHYKNYISARDSLLNEENTKRTVKAQMQYEFDKKQAADSIRNGEKIKQEHLKHEQEIRQQQLYTYGGIMGFALMMVVAGVSFRAYRQKQKANLIIQQQKQLVEEKQKEILDSIYYARRIQRSLLPSEKFIERTLTKLHGHRA